MRKIKAYTPRYVMLIITFVILCMPSYAYDLTKSELLKAYFDSSCKNVLPVSTETMSENATDGEFWYYKGLCEKQAGDYSNAYMSFQLSQNHGHSYIPAVYYNLGISKANLGDFEQAINYFKISKKLGLRDIKLYDRP